MVYDIRIFSMVYNKIKLHIAQNITILYVAYTMMLCLMIDAF